MRDDNWLLSVPLKLLYDISSDLMCVQVDRLLGSVPENKFLYIHKLLSFDAS